MYEFEQMDRLSDIKITENSSDFSNNHYVSGYFNTTSAITGLQFKMESGDVDAGTIKLYGIT